MTVKLYDLYPYDTFFQAEVISCEKCERGYDVVLDQTLFFPEEGGQNCDKGTISDKEVLYVGIKDDVIHHYLKEAVQGKVEGKIDFHYRYVQMQNHSGEHILSGLMFHLYGFHNVGFHLGDHEITTDYDGYLTHEQLNEIEKKVNEVIMANKKITGYYPENAETMEYRCKKEIQGAIRIVEIEDVDCCACCAPHVRSTAEIGVFKIVKAMKYKKGMIIYFLCGEKAYEDYCLKHEEVHHISGLLSSPVYQIDHYVERLLEENSRLKQEIAAFKRQTIEQRCHTLAQKPYHLVFESDIDRSLQQFYINELMKKCDDMAAVFVGDETGYRFMIASKNDARCYLQLLKDHFVVKGGGKADMVQGTIAASQKEITAFLQQEI